MKAVLDALRNIGGVRMAALAEVDLNHVPSVVPC